MLYFWVVNIIPAVLIVAALVCHYTRPVVLSRSRSVLFGCGLLTGTIGSILLTSFLMVNIADPSHVGHVNVWDGRLLIAGFSTALVSVALSSTGRGIARALSASSSFALIVLFYIDGLATSI
jgi:hypothetical protein